MEPQNTSDSEGARDLDRHVLSESERAPAPGARAVGPVDADERIEVSVRLRRRPEAPPLPAGAFDAEPPGERAYVTREELAASHGADPDDAARVQTFAAEHGLEVTSVDLARRTVTLAGTAAAFSSAFQVDLQRYESLLGPYRGRVGALTVPADLREVVEGIFGLDDRPQARPHLVTRAASLDPARVGPMSYTAPQVAALYDFPTHVDGSGQCIGIVEFGGGYIAQDLRAYFEAIAGRPGPEVAAVGVDGASNDPQPPDARGNTPDGEVMLDLEVAGSVAPGAKLVVYFAPFTERGWVDVLSTAVHDSVNKPSVISISWGWPEGQDLWTIQALRTVDETLQEAAAVGVTVLCASGDDGSADEIPDGMAHVDFPASSPHIVACGGTSLYAGIGGTQSVETVWNNGPRGAGGGASGGGVSSYFRRPYWQASAHVPRALNTWARGRGVPDVAGNADPQTGYRTRVRGRWGVTGGTSAVAPLYAGLVALVNERLAAAGASPLGYPNPLLYTRLAGTPVFRDVVYGTNDTTGYVGGYPARAGWDACTGWGSIDGSRLVEALTAPDAQIGLRAVGTTWQQVPGAASDVAVAGDGTLWAVGVVVQDEGGFGVYRWSGQEWDGPEVSAVRIAAGAGGDVAVVDARGRVQRRAAAGGWEQLPGQAVDVAVDSDGTVLVVGGDARLGGWGVARWTGGDWEQLDAAGVRISAGPAGEPCVIAADGSIAQLVSGRWRTLPGFGLDIGVGADGSIWAVGLHLWDQSGFCLYRWEDEAWDPTPGGATAVAVAADGLPVIVDLTGNVYRRA
jgi:kumamolisin